MLCTIFTASDRLFVIWFCLPSLTLSLILIISKHLTFKRAFIYFSIIGLAIISGFLLDAHLRNFNTHFSPDMVSIFRLCKNFILSFIYTFNILKQSYLVLFTFGAGLVGLIFGLFNDKLRLLCLYSFIAIFINVSAISLHGFHQNQNYLFIWYALPYTVGIFTLIGLFKSSNKIIPWLVALAVSIFIFCHTAQVIKNVRQPYYPELVEKLDALARATGVKTGIADHWEARLVSMLSKEELELIGVYNYGFKFLSMIYTQALIKDKYDMLIINEKSDPYSGVNKELEINMNGQPDEIIKLNDHTEVLIYKNGAKHPTEAQIVLEGSKLIPEMAKGDATHFQGKLSLNNGLTLTKASSAPRDGRHLLLLFFDEDQSKIMGTEFEIIATGNATTKYRRKLANWIHKDISNVLNNIYLLFIPGRTLKVTLENSASLPDGKSVAWGKLPSWNSKTWEHIFIKVNGKLYNVKP